MFFDVYYNSSATQYHGGNIRHLKKGLGLQFGLLRRVLLTYSQNKKKEWCWPAAAVYPKKKKRPSSGSNSGHLTPYLLSKKEQRMGHGPDRGQSCSGWPSS